MKWNGYGLNIKFCLVHDKFLYFWFQQHLEPHRNYDNYVISILCFGGFWTRDLQNNLDPLFFLVNKLLGNDTHISWTFMAYAPQDAPPSMSVVMKSIIFNTAYRKLTKRRHCISLWVWHNIIICGNHFINKLYY